MACTAVAILDRDSWTANTDIVVVVDSMRRRLTWVPRDLWSAPRHDRINAAFAIGGCEEMLAALADLGFACDGALCLRRAATEALLGKVDVSVPVGETLEFWYPLAPAHPIEDGRKRIVFEPPAARLRGELVHQWIGARYSVAGRSSDLLRLARQQTLLTALLRSGFDFGPALSDPELVRASGEHPLDPLLQIDATWTMTIFRDVIDATIDGKAVLLPASGLQRLRRRIARGLGALSRRRA